jgi:glutaredoxin
MPRILATLICLAVCSLSSAQTVYKSIGPDGKVVYSDKPPTQGRVEKTLRFDNLPSSPLPAGTLSDVEQLRRMKAPAQPSSRETVLYSAAWCGYCRQAKAFLASRGIAYSEIDIETPSGKAAFAQVGGGRGVPLLFFKGQRIQGFSPQAYDAVFSGGG